MPNSTHAIHPSGKLGITFTEDDHKYIDDWRREYISCTTLIHSAFKPFNAQEAAALKSARTGVPAEQYIAEWQAIGENSSKLGTRTHENCERQILGRYSEMHTPIDEEEKQRFRAAWYEVERLKRTYATLEPEKLVFSPRFNIAGSIDVLATGKDNSVSIIDWKFIKELKTTAYQGRTGTHIATENLPDCNFYHYALQLNIYEQILKVEKYIRNTAEVVKQLAVYNFIEHKFQFVKLPELPREALLLMAFHATFDGLDDEVPF